MEKDQENLNPELPPQKSSENFPIDDHATSLEKNIPESKYETESENDDSINGSLDEKEKSRSGKGWFFILALLSILSAGTYFYFHKNKLDIFENLSWDVKKIFPEFANTTSPLGIEPKKLFIEPIEPNTNQNEFDGSPENLIANKEKKISFLQKEIQSLKFKQNNIPLLPGKITNKIQQPIDSSFDKKPETINQIKEKKSLPEAENLLAPPLSIKVEPIDKGESEKQQTKEVQAYLDFVENTGSKLVELVKKGWAKLNQLILSNKQNA